jgi:hypothetical protein
MTLKFEQVAACHFETQIIRGSVVNKESFLAESASHVSVIFTNNET